MLKRICVLLTLACALLTSGCAFFRPDRIHYTWQENAAKPCVACKPAKTDGDFIAVALSGGGARASVFGAAAIEALTEAGVMSQVTHISSVSGGGFPAVYYALNKPVHCTEESVNNGKACEADEFRTFKQAMRHNFLTDLTLRQIASPNRFSSPTRRLSSLQDALDKQFVRDAVFGDLPPSPVLLINGARYDDARRFVFSNLAIPEKESDIAPFTEQTLRTASFSLPGCVRATPPEFSVALAIAISAGFPPLLGPAAIEAPNSCDGGATRYWHLGDGGILDNTGVETLEDFALHAYSGEAIIERVVIFSFDAGRSTSPDVMMNTRNLKLWTSDPGRVVDIVGKRASAYRNIVLNDNYVETGVSFHIVKMRYTDAQISTWPASCGDREDSAAAISAHLATIPTNFQITDCDADLMEIAAHDLVRRALVENRDALQTAGVSLRR